MKKTLIILFLVLFIVFNLSAAVKCKINSFDSITVMSYNAKLDETSTALSLTSLSIPILFAFTENSLKDKFTVGLMYAETIALTYGLKELGKNLINRDRPYTYFENHPSFGEDDIRSFPSGHTALSFASASFTSYVFSLFYSDSNWRIPVTLISFSSAITIAVLRVYSGSHFLTDVIAGALMGSIIGITIPLLHTLNTEDVSLSASPFHLAFNFNF